MAQLEKYGAKIDTMNLGPVIIKLRKNASLKEVADHINRYYLKDGDSITAEAIRKWEKKNNIVQERAVIPIGVPVDTYNKVITNHNRSIAQLSRLDSEMFKLRNSVFTEEEEAALNRLIDTGDIPASLKTKMEDMLVYNRTNTMTTLLGLYNTAIANDHKIALDMVKVEKDMFNVNNNKTIIDAIVGAVVQLDKETTERDAVLSRELGTAIPTYSLKQRYYEILQENPEIWKTIQKKG
jgi:hypothetical protein